MYASKKGAKLPFTFLAFSRISLKTRLAQLHGALLAHF